MLWLPTVVKLVLSVAVLVAVVPVVATMPITVVPSLKVMRPVGDTPATLAVSVILTPTTAVVTLVVKVVVVAACALKLKAHKLNNNTVASMVHR